jgi:hypothetical protein
MRRELRIVQKMVRMTLSEEKIFLSLVGYNGNWTWSDLILEGLGMLLEAKSEEDGSKLPIDIRVKSRKKRRGKPL